MKAIKKKTVILQTVSLALMALFAVVSVYLSYKAIVLGGQKLVAQPGGGYVLQWTGLEEGAAIYLLTLIVSCLAFAATCLSASRKRPAFYLITEILALLAIIFLAISDFDAQILNLVGYKLVSSRSSMTLVIVSFKVIASLLAICSVVLQVIVRDVTHKSASDDSPRAQA